MNSESFRVENIEPANRPEKLYRGFTVDPELLSLEALNRELIPGSVNKDDQTKIGDGNELGVYMSTNPSMVETAYVNSNIDSVNVIVPRFIDRGGITNIISLPTCGIVVEVDAKKVDIRSPQITSTLKGVYNNGFQGDEWIADSVPKEAYRVTKLILSKNSYDQDKLVLDVRDFDERQMTEAIFKIKDEFKKKKEEAVEFKAFLETLPESERMNEFVLKRKWEKYPKSKNSQ